MESMYSGINRGDLKLPSLRPLPDKGNLQAWTKMCSNNRSSIMVWNSKVLQKMADPEPSFEQKYNVKAVHISMEDLEFFRCRLHPDDFRRYAPVGDSTVDKGKYVVYVDEFYKIHPLCDTEVGENREYELMMEAERELFGE